MKSRVSPVKVDGITPERWFRSRYNLFNTPREANDVGIDPVRRLEDNRRAVIKLPENGGNSPVSWLFDASLHTKSSAPDSKKNFEKKKKKSVQDSQGS